MRQTICFQGDAGHHYMDIYDDVSPVVRSRLQNSTINICMACIRDTMSINDVDFHSDLHWFICIEAFEKGNIDDLRKRIHGPNRSAAYRRIQGFYGDPNYPPADFYDPRRIEPRCLADTLRRIPQTGMVPGFDRLGLDDLRKELEDVMFIPSRYLK